jgi:hypothetical protein
VSFYRPIAPGNTGSTAADKRIAALKGGNKPRSTGKTQQQGPDSGASPGTYNVNLLDPVSSGTSAAGETQNLFVGLQQGLFGSDTENRYGQHGGLLGDAPGPLGLIGHVGRGITNAIGVGGEIVAGAAGKVLDFAETDTAGKAFAAATPGGEVARAITNAANEDKFNALPKDSPAYLTAQEELAAEGGADRRGHIITEALKAREAEKSLEHPTLYSGMFVPGPSVTDTIGVLLDSMSLLLRPVERMHAGGEDAGNAGRSGLNRVEEIMAVGQGKLESFGTVGGFGADIGKTMTPLEQTVFQKVSDHEWSEDEALDYLTANSSGFSRDPLWEAASSAAYDPLTWASVGAGAAASVGVKATKLAELTIDAEKALTAARLTGDAAQIETAQAGLEGVLRAGAKLKGTSARINLYGKAMETERAGGIIRFAGAPYVRLQGTALGKTAKVARTILDPMSAMTGLNPGAVKHMDLLTDETVKRVVDGMGQMEHLHVVERLKALHPELAELFNKDFGVYSGNLMRRVVGDEHRAAQYAAGLNEELRKTLPDDVVEEIIHKGAPTAYGDRIMEEANRFRIREGEWDADAIENLVTRLSKMYKHLEPEEWRAEVNDILKGSGGADMLSYLHASTYGYATRRLVDTVAAARKTGISTLGDKLSKLVIINKRTLTKQGAGGILKRLDEASGLEEQYAMVQKELSLYSTLDFVDLDPSSIGKSVEDFRNNVSRIYNSLPTQVESDELAGMGDDFAGFMDEMQGSYNLGFMPDDEYLWGLERSNKVGGRLAPVGSVWTGHVGTEVGTFNPMRELPHNIIGQALPRTVGKVYKTLDHIDALGRAYKSRVTGTVIAEAAKARLVDNLITTGDGFNAMTRKEANKVAETLLDAVDANSAIVTARGLSSESMYNVVKDAIPPRLSGQIGPKEMMTAVVDAYEGDLRFVGLTQKFTGRAKKYLGRIEGHNRLGQLAEDLYPRLKFHLNPFFQLQEKIEPWVLSAQRGVAPIYGSEMNAADLATRAVLDRMNTSSVIRMADVDMYEQSAKVLVSGKLGKTATTHGTNLNAALNALSGSMDVQGTKRVAMLRSFRKGLGREMKKAYDEGDVADYEGALKAAQDAGESTAGIVKRDTWKEMQSAMSIRQGGLVSDDDFAISMLADNFQGNDFMTKRVNELARRWTPDEYMAAMGAEWAAPQHIGAMKALGLNNMAEALKFSGIGNEADLRSAISEGRLGVEDVVKALAQRGADADYMTRVRNALNFSWEGFWNTAERQFSLTGKQSAALQDFVAASARMHDDMSPLEYISQVFSPGILDGENGTLGSLGRTIDIIRDGKLVGTKSDLATLVGGEGARHDDLVRQMSSVFADHLDPSAKVALLREFGVDVKRAVAAGDATITSHAGVEYNLADIAAAWNPQVEEQLAQRIISGIQHEPLTSFQELVERRPTLLGQDLLKGLPEEYQGAIVDELNAFTRDFPDVNLKTVNINHDFHTKPRPDYPQGYPLDTQAATRNFEGNRQTTMHLSPRYFTGSAADREAAWGSARGRNELAWATDGAPEVVSATPEGAIRHELGHALLKHLEERVASRLDEMTADQMQAARAVINHVKAMYGRYGPSAPHSSLTLSRYASGNVDEFGGEVYDLAFGPQVDLNLYFEKKIANLREDGSVSLVEMPGELAKIAAQRADVEKFRTLVEETHLHAPPSAPPDIERTVQAFGEWAHTAVGALIRGSDDPSAAEALATLERMGKLSKGAGTVYNATEAHLMRAVADTAAEKFNDAYRLQYYARGRTMFERSINHPMFGLYPASYMWGKMLPEMVRFVGATPFGVHTTAMAYALHDVQKAVGAQREFDPEFDAFIEKLGHSQSMFALSYLLPAAPWDIPATAPAWMRNIAQQGLDQASAMKQGKPVKTDISLYNAAEKSAEQMSPLRGAKAINSAITELVKPTQESLAQASQERAQQATGPVQAADLGPTLEESMAQLREVLATP